MNAGANFFSSAGVLLSFGAAAVAALCIVLLHPLLIRYTLARPNARSSHRQPTPQGGGIAVIGATTLAIACFALFAPSAAGDPIKLALLFVSVIGLAAVGVTDDIKPLGVAPRLLLQALAVIVVIAILPSGLRLISALPWWLERALIFIGVLWFVNLANFMDGIDWMTVAETVPLTGTLALFGLMGALPPQGTLVALALCGAMIGFAPFNRPVARLFLGDVGSLPIGLLLAWLLVLLAEDHLAAAVLLPLYYVADATITLVRRVATGRSVTQAHRDHFYQRAFDNGRSVYSIVTWIFVLNIALSALAALTLAIPSRPVHVVALVVGCVLVGWLLAYFARAKR